MTGAWDRAIFEQLKRIADALERAYPKSPPPKPKPRDPHAGDDYYGIGGYGSQER
jgi:hypothetical protein